MVWRARALSDCMFGNLTSSRACYQTCSSLFLCCWSACST